MGKFIALEGLDGSGKSYQAKKIVEYLAQKGYKVYNTYEPTEGAIGTLIRRIQKGEAGEYTEATMLHLYTADRIEHNKLIKAALDKGEWVICDRYILSSIAYQGFEKEHLSPYMLNVDLIRPDINIILDISAGEALKRVHGRDCDPEMYENEAFLTKVRQAYESSDRYNSYFGTVWKVDASKSKEEVTENIIRIIERNI